MENGTTDASAVEQKNDQISETSNNQNTKNEIGASSPNSLTLESSKAKQSSKKRIKLVLAAIATIALVLSCYFELKPDATHLLAATFPKEKTIVFIDPIKLRIIKTKQLDYEPEAAAFSPKCDQIVLNDRNSNKIYLYNLPSFSLEGSFEINFHPHSIDWNPPTPKELICHGKDIGQISFNIKNSLASNKIVEGVEVPVGTVEIEGVHEIFGASSNTNSNHEINIVFDTSLNEVIAYKGDSSKPITTIPVGKSPTAIGWDNNHRFCFVVVNGDNNIAVIDIKKLKIIKRIKTFRDPEHFIILKPTNLALLFSRIDESLALFNMSSKRITKTLKLPGDVSCLTVWPNPEFDEYEAPEDAHNEDQEPPRQNHEQIIPIDQPNSPHNNTNNNQPRNFSNENETSVLPAMGIPQSPAPGSPESPAPGIPQPPAEAKPPSGETPAPGIPKEPLPGAPKDPERSAPASVIPTPGIPKEPAPGKPEEPVSEAQISTSANTAPSSNSADNNMQH